MYSLLTVIVGRVFWKLKCQILYENKICIELFLCAFWSDVYLVRVCVCACVRVCVYVCVRVRVYVCVRVRVCKEASESKPKTTHARPKFPQQPCFLSTTNILH